MTSIGGVSANFSSSQTRSRHATSAISCLRQEASKTNQLGQVVVKVWTDIMSPMGTTDLPVPLVPN